MIESGDGILLVDKPAGITSAHVVAKIKRRFRLSRVGHAGTLDPFATGLLVVLSGRATKLQSQVMASRKRYQGEIRLGISTDTDDITGKTRGQDVDQSLLDDDQLAIKIEKAKLRFLGEQLQVPPAYSAIKVQGKRSYDLARRGQAKELTPRSINIYSLELERVDRELVRYDIVCSKGTYIRSFARDLGEYLGIPACLESLCRLESGPLLLENARPLDQLLEREDLVGELIPPMAIAQALQDSERVVGKVAVKGREN